MNKAVFIDRDGVINKRFNDPDDPYNNYVLRWEDFEFLPGVLDALVRLDMSSGYRIYIISNQSGISENLIVDGEPFTKSSAMVIFSQMEEAIDKYARDKYDRLTDWHGGVLSGWMFCPHSPDDGCACRKPKPGMIYLFAVTDEICLSDSWMIGDSVSDMKCGWNAGIRKLIKLPSLEDPKAPVYDYNKARESVAANKRIASGVLIDNLENAVDYILRSDGDKSAR